MKHLPIIALCLAMPGAADAQQRACGPAAEMIAGLTGPKYAEVQQTLGFVGTPPTGNVLATFANEETGTWTVMEVSPQGVACIVSAGNGWMAAAPASPKMADPT
jgi:hypothetical protein